MLVKNCPLQSISAKNKNIFILLDQRMPFNIRGEVSIFDMQINTICRMLQFLGENSVLKFIR